jgi:glutathione S-transferase
MNQNVPRALNMQNVATELWAKSLMERRLEAFEKIAAPRAGNFYYGDELTLAGVVLAPTVVNARRYGIGVSVSPTLSWVVEVFEGMEAFRRGGWKG